MESNAFTADQSQITIPNGSYSATFTITFHPDEETTGTMEGLLTVSCTQCTKTANLEGMVPTSGIANSLPNNVSIIVSPNPATDNVNILTNGARTAEIGIYDLLGKEFASQKTTNWNWNTTSVPPGYYFVRIAGKSNLGEAFVTSKRIIISR
jgi:hypothetical protein